MFPIAATHVASSRSLEPGALEIVDWMVYGAEEMNRRPEVLIIDSITALPFIVHVFEDTGLRIRCMYLLRDFPRPPELGYSTLRHTCEICQAMHRKDGRPLLTCPACKEAYYCCNRHREQDWSSHQAECTETLFYGVL
ncbi:zinc finger MYND domain-containing protein [archaeon]|nr:MAG: zinc finger MYND domain-containing protein [archaeon]